MNCISSHAFFPVSLTAAPCKYILWKQHQPCNCIRQSTIFWAHNLLQMTPKRSYFFSVLKSCQLYGTTISSNLLTDSHGIITLKTNLSRPLQQRASVGLFHPSQKKLQEGRGEKPRKPTVSQVLQTWPSEIYFPALQNQDDFAKVFFSPNQIIKSLIFVKASYRKLLEEKLNHHVFKAVKTQDQLYTGNNFIKPFNGNFILFKVGRSQKIM